MVRPLPLSPTLHHHHNLLPFSSIPIPFFALVLAVFSVISMVAFLCGSSHRMTKLQNKKTEESPTLLSKLNSNLSNKAISMVKMISWRKVQAEEEEEEEHKEYSEEEDDEALWKKNILMGEKCRPLDFSGQIAYDSKGNMLPDFTHHHPNGCN